MTKIEVLNDRDHVLLRPGMVIGSTKHNSEEMWALEDDKFVYKEVSYVPAFLKLFDEIISNSIDEAIRTEFEYANKIEVGIDGITNDITVKDNGRGIPYTIEETTGLPQSVVAFTHLRAGSNFNDETSTIGQNGVGASCVNIFSTEFYVSTCDGTTRTILECSDNMGNIDYKISKSKISGTTVRYQPDLGRLSMDAIDQTHFWLIQKRVIDLAVCYPQIEFKFCGKPLIASSFSDYAKMFSEKASVFEFENVSIGVFPSEDFIFSSHVNGIDTKRGGTHVSVISSTIPAKVREVLGKKYKEIKPQDVRNKTGLVVLVRNLQAPRFDSQTKEHLINSSSEMGDTFTDVDWQKIVRSLVKNKEYTEPIIDLFRAKEEIKRRKALASKERTSQKLKIPKHVEALGKDRGKCTLHISEGDSATSSFLACRDKNAHSIYPLRGKFVNVYERTDLEVLQNKEAAGLISVMGLKLSSDSIVNLRYGKIAILTDMDVDGDSIFASLVSFFYKYWPELIRREKLVRVLSPLITTESGKTFYSIKDYENNACNEKIAKYNKGLGGLGRDAYADMLRNPVEVVVTEGEAASALRHLEMAFGKDANLRKEWIVGTQND